MAKIQVLTKRSRGKAICSKCGKEILSREKYLKATPFRRSPITRCLLCGLKPYETSCSPYKKQVGKLIYDWKKTYGIYDRVVDDIISEIENIKYDIESNLENMPEQFQDYSVLQDRLDGLDDCLDILNNIDVSEEIESEIINALSCILIS